jgi:NADH-quinone oxidoreductase subunit N
METSALVWWQVPEVSWLAFGCFLLLAQVFSHESTVFERIGRLTVLGYLLFLGASFFWPEAWLGVALKGRYVWDGVAIFFKRLFLGCGLFVALMARKGEPKQISQRSEFLTWFAVGGMGFLASVQDLATLFVALELVTVTFYILVSFYRSNILSIEAGVKYLVLGALSTGCLVYGIVYLFGNTQALYFSQIAEALSSQPLNLGLGLGVLLLLVGVAFKVGLVPFHWWIPDVYQGAPTPITAFLSVGSKSAGIVVLWRLLTGPFENLVFVLTPILVVISALSILFGSLGALAQRDVKRLMGYSSISHAGFLLMGFIASDFNPSAAVLFYLGVYAVATLGIFMVVSLLSESLGGTHLSRFQGLSRRNPGAALALVVGMVSLAGIPPLAGFWGKWMVFWSAWQTGYSILVFVGAFGAVVSIYYYLALVKSLFFEEPSQEMAPVRLGFFSQVAIYLLMLANLALGVFPGWMDRMVQATLAFVQ